MIITKTHDGDTYSHGSTPIAVMRMVGAEHYHVSPSDAMKHLEIRPRTCLGKKAAVAYVLMIFEEWNHDKLRHTVSA